MELYSEGTRVRIIQDRDMLRSKIKFVGKIAVITSVHQGRNGHHPDYPYSLKFDEEDVNHDNFYIWGHKQMELFIEEPVITPIENKIEVGKRVLVMMVHDPDDETMNAYIGHTAVVKNIETKYKTDFPVYLEFENPILEELSTVIGEMSYGYEELLDLTGLEFKDPPLKIPEVGDRVVIIKNTANESPRHNTRNGYISEKGCITTDHNYGFRYVIDFDDEELNESSASAGTWCWAAEEVVVIKKKER